MEANPWPLQKLFISSDFHCRFLLLHLIKNTISLILSADVSDIFLINVKYLQFLLLDLDELDTELKRIPTNVT